MFESTTECFCIQVWQKFEKSLMHNVLLNIRLVNRECGKGKFGAETVSLQFALDCISALTKIL